MIDRSYYLHYVRSDACGNKDVKRIQVIKFYCVPIYWQIWISEICLFKRWIQL